jgi:DNA-binding transcriptional LysR family regulator
MHVTAHLLANGQFLTATSKLIANRYTLKVLPVALPAAPSPIVAITLKNRTLSPVVERFIECARGIAKSMASMQPAHKS